MARFVTDWYAPLTAEEGVSEAELASVRAPDALAALFRLAGRAPRVLSSQNAITSFDDWKRSAATGAKRQRLYTENQGVWTVDVDPAGEDASLSFESWPEEKGLPPMERLPGFLLQAVVFEAIFGAPQLAMGTCSSSALVAAVAPLSKLPLAPWHWPAYPGEFWAGDGVCLFRSPLDHESSYVSAGAREAGRFDWLARVEAEWDSIGER